MTHQTRLRALAGVTVALVVMSVSSSVSAETLLLMVDSGQGNRALVQNVAQRLEAAGLQVQVASASLEDTALLLGCEPEEDECLDLVAKTGGADSILILPAGKGSLTARRGQTSRSAPSPSSADDDAGWRRALETSLEIELSAATTEHVDEPESVQANPDDIESEPSTDSVTESEASLVAQSQTHLEGSPLSRVRTRSWIVLGSGAAVGGLGLLFLGIASSKQDEVNAHPIDSAADLDALAELESSGENFTLAGNLALVGGSLAMLAGVGLVVWDSRHGRAEQTVTIAPSIADTSVGLTFSWSSH